MNDREFRLFKIRTALEVATAIRRRAGEGLPEDWDAILEMAMPCRVEECPGWLDSAEPDVSLIRDLERCACTAFRSELEPLRALRLLDIPPLPPASLEKTLQAHPPLAWQTIGDVAQLSARVWGFLCRRRLRHPFSREPEVRRATPSQRKSLELLWRLQDYESLLFDHEIAFLPGHFLRKRYLSPTLRQGEPLIWVSCGRTAVVVLDAFLGRPPWGATSPEIAALERLISDLARLGAGLVVFSSCELVSPKRASKRYLPNYESGPARGSGAPPPVATLLHPGALDRLWELLALGQASVEG